MSSDESVAPISRENVKMPKFLPDQPATFFVMIEAQFVLRNVTSDDAKYCHVVSALPPEVVSRIVDLVTAPPTTDKYDAIKKRLTKSFAKTPAERATKLLEISDLGGRSPLALLDEMRNLSRGEDIDFVSTRFDDDELLHVLMMMSSLILSFSNPRIPG